MSGSTGSVPAFQGSFHFVHHDESNMKALPHRKAVFTHVQNNYRAWKNKNKIQQLRASASIPKDFASRSREAKDAKADPLDPQTSGDSDAPLANMKKKMMPSSLRASKDSQSPWSVVQKGQSDPFSVYSVKIDARVNQIMTFYRDEVMPLLFDGPAFAEAKKLNWRNILNALEIPGAAYCCLARNSAAAAIVAPSTELAKQTYLYQARSTKLLREHLDQESMVLSKSTALWIFTLFDAEVMARNLPAALAHGRVLVRSFEIQSQRGPVDLMVLTNLLFSDLNLACTFLIRPLFDTDEWMPRMFRPLFVATESSLPQLHSLPTGVLDSSIRDGKLLSIFKERRESDYLRKLMFRGTQELPLSLTVWITVRSMLHLAGLINLYLDYAASLQNSLASTQNTWVQTYLALAAIFLVRMQRYNKILHGVRLYESGLQMASELRRLLTEEQRCSDFVSGEFVNARLWALYIGAFAEQLPLRDRPNPTTAWFNVNLAAQARQMNLYSWQSVREVLERFIYDDTMQPHGSQWFFKTLAANLEGLGYESLPGTPDIPPTIKVQIES